MFEKLNCITLSNELCRALLLLFVVTLTSCDNLYDEFFRNPYTRVITQSIDVDERWNEIVIDPPLKVINAIQTIEIFVPNIEKWEMEVDILSTDINNLNQMPKQRIYMPDGQLINIEVQLIAADGTVFKLNSIQLGNSLGFTHFPEDIDVISPKHPSLPKNKQFSKVRIRADRPVKGGKVLWICTTQH